MKHSCREQSCGTRTSAKCSKMHSIKVLLPVWLFEHCHSQYKQQLSGLSSLVWCIFCLRKLVTKITETQVLQSWSSSSFSYDMVGGAVFCLWWLGRHVVTMCWPWEICAGANSWKAVDISSYLLYATTPEGATHGNAYKDGATYSAQQRHCTPLSDGIGPTSACLKAFGNLVMTWSW